MMNRKPQGDYVSYNYGFPVPDTRTAFLLLRTDWQRSPRRVLLTLLRDWLKGALVFSLCVEAMLVLLVPMTGGLFARADFFAIVGELLFDLYPVALVMGAALAIFATLLASYLRYSDLALVLADEPAYRSGSAFGSEAEREGMARALLENTQFIVTYAPGVTRPEMSLKGDKE